MIAKMTKYSFVLMNSFKKEFLEKIREFGVVDITRSVKPVDSNSEEMLESISGLKSAIESIEKIDWSSDEKAEAISKARNGLEPFDGNIEEEIPALLKRISELNNEKTLAIKDMKNLIPWGEFNAAELAKLSDAGVTLHFFITSKKKFDENWKELWPVEVISEEDDNIFFVVAGDHDIPVQEITLPDHDVTEANARISEIDDQIILCKARLESFKDLKEDLEKRYCQTISDLNLYLAGVSGRLVAEEKICVLQGFAPVENDETICSELDQMEVYYIKEEAKEEDNPPIKLKNNKFASMFEVFTRMYGMPVYGEFDHTAILGPFYLLFFAFCMGDAGYGLLLMLISQYLKTHDILNMGLTKHHKLVFFLGLSTFVIGTLLGTFFGMPLAEQAWVPEGFKNILLTGSIMGYDLQMVLAVAIGVFHLCFAMTMKALCYTKRDGFRATVSTWCWLIVIVGGIIIAALALLGVMSKPVTKIVIIIAGTIAALGIFVFNTPGRNPLINIGAGLWDTYGMASGLMGDALSYIRLYALGMAGGMLGAAFNNLATMIKDIPVLGVNWIGFIFILIFGHALNLGMSCLGAFVHPLRLTFVEYFKNSGYNGKGQKYNPLKS